MTISLTPQQTQALLNWSYSGESGGLPPGFAVKSIVGDAPGIVQTGISIAIISYGNDLIVLPRGTDPSILQNIQEDTTLAQNIQLQDFENRGTQYIGKSGHIYSRRRQRHFDHSGGDGVRELAGGCGHC